MKFNDLHAYPGSKWSLSMAFTAEDLEIGEDQSNYLGLGEES